MVKNSITIPSGSALSDFITAFTSIGFTNDSEAQTSTTAELYWGEDTDHNYKVVLTLPSSGSISVYGRDATYTNTSNVITFHNGTISVASSVSSVNAILDYITFGDSILFELRLSTAVEKFMGGFIAPIGSNDSWYMIGQEQYGGLYNTLWRAKRNPFQTAYNCNLTQNSVQTAVEVSKFYDATGYIDNMYAVTLHPDCASGQVYKAIIGLKTFLCYNFSQYAGGNCAHIAFDITSEAS